MEINKHIGFDADDKLLIKYLKKHNIKYNAEGYALTLDIYESSPHWEEINKIVGKLDLLCLSETVFSKEELLSAEWMEVRSVWHYSYPQPENEFGYKSVTYTKDDYCSECGAGLVQTELFRIKKEPSWRGKRHFLMLNWVEDELFVDETAKALLEREFSFLSFCGVKNKKGTETLENIFQIIIPVLKEEGIVEKQRSIQEVMICPCCKRKKYHPVGEGMLQFRRNVFENAPDMVKSAEWFGWGHGADRTIIISQKMYQFILSHHLEKNLEFSPIELVD